MAKDSVPRRPSVLYNTLQTIFIRCLSFLGTQYCIRRFTSPIVLGTNVQLELVMIFILLISREGFRLAVSNDRSSESPNGDSLRAERGNDLAFLTIPLSFFMTAMGLLLHGYHCSKGKDTDDYQWAGILYCLAALVEGCAEPVVLYYLQFVSIAEKAAAEGVSAMMKTISTVAILQIFQSNIVEQYPITVLGMSQLIYAITYNVFLYFTAFSRGQLRNVLPKWQSNNTSSWTNFLKMHQPTLKLIGLFTLQSILKFLLTEGDRILLSLLAGRYDQGVYALGNAYGGLAARLLLQPVEETARLLFRQQCSAGQRDPKTQQRSYVVGVKAVLYVGLIFSCLAVNYTYILLNILAGRYWGSHTEAVAVLSGFCVYTAFLAGNGMTEAFVYGISQTASDIGRLSMAHTVSGAGFALLAPLAVTKYGTLGLVAANCFTMLIRTAFSVYYAARYLGQQQGSSTPRTMIQLLRLMIPHPIVFLLFAFTFLGTQSSLQRMLARISVFELVPMSIPWLRLAIEHVGVGVACGIGTISFAYLLERDFQKNVRILWHHKKD